MMKLLRRVILIPIFVFTSYNVCYAGCSCVVELSNYANGTITVNKVKTTSTVNLGIAIVPVSYKTQWNGSRTIKQGNRSRFSFTADFACNKKHGFRFIRKDGKKCTRGPYKCGTSNNPLQVSCHPYDWN